MKTKAATEAGRRWSRRCIGAARSLSPLAVIGITLAVVLGGAGVASAGPPYFILGQNNRWTARSDLSNSRGTPLMLNAAPGNAPLKVNNKVQVPDLNASEVGTYTSKELAFGGDDYTTPQTDTSIDNNGEIVASTGPLRTGTYYVTGTAMIHVAPGDGYGGCWITKGSTFSDEYADGQQQQEGMITVAETTAISVSGGDNLQEVCYSGGYNGSYLWNAGLTAIRVLSYSGTAPASHGRPVAAMRHALAAPRK
jgi:hypothetical protein